MREKTGEEIWGEWMEELTPPYTVMYNPAGILYAKEQIDQLTAERDHALRANIELASINAGLLAERDALREALKAIDRHCNGRGLTAIQVTAQRALLNSEEG